MDTAAGAGLGIIKAEIPGVELLLKWHLKIFQMRVRVTSLDDASKSARGSWSLLGSHFG